MDPDRSEEKDGESGRTTPTMKNNLRRGVEFFNSKRYEQAILEWSKVLREDPTNKKALDFITKARLRLSKTATEDENAKVAADAAQCFKIGLQYFEEEEYQMAINQWIRALTYEPENSDALEYIRRAQQTIQSGAAPTKARPGLPPASAKVLRDSESGAFTRAEVPATPAPAAATPAAKPGGKRPSEADNKALAAEAEALYEEILGGGAPAPAGGGKKAGGAKSRGSGSTTRATEAPRAPGLVGSIFMLPRRHPFLLLGIVAVAIGVFGALYFIFMASDWVTEMAKAKQKIKEQNWFDCVQALNAADGYKQNDPETLFLRGSCYNHLTDWDHAIKDLERTTSLDTKNGEAWYQLGLAQSKKNMFTEARASLRQSCGNGNDNADVKALMASVLTQLGVPEDIIKECAGGGIETQPPSVKVRLGWIDLLSGDYAPAIEKAELAIVDVPGEEYPYLLKVRALEQMGKLDDAIGAANSGIELVSLAPRLHYLKANIQLQKGDFEGAVNTMREAESHGGDYRYHLELGNIWMRQYRRNHQDFLKERAVTAYKEAMEMSDDGYVPLAWGRALQVFGDQAGADAKLRDAAGRFKGTEVDDFGYSYLWMTYYLLKDWDKALQTLDKNIADNQNTITSLAAKGMTLFAKGSKDGAKEAFEMAASKQKGKKIVAPVEYADISVEDVRAMMTGAGL